MGKAALELPDPLQSDPLKAPEGPGARTSTDELLSQLAGEEIDRLLAEADGLRFDDAPGATSGLPPAAPLAPAPVHVAPPADPEKGQEPHAVFADAPPTDVSAPDAPVPVAPDEDVTAELDALFSAAVAKDEEAAAEAATAAAAAATDLAAGTGAEERAALTTIQEAAVEAAASARPKVAPAAAADTQDGGALPLYLRPLAWLNAPLLLLPEGVRDFVGKVAILTLLNAAAILVYVLVFRR